MPSGCARLPSCRGRKGDGTGGTVKIVPAKAGAAGLAAAKAKELAAKAAPAKTAPVKDVATSSSKKKGKGKGPPPAAAAFLAKKRAEEQAAAAAACASASDEASASAVQYESDSQSIDQAATVSFDTFDPAQDDFEGIQALLGDMIDADEFDAAGLVRLVLAEAGNVGMTIKIADEDEVRGVLSVVETTHASHPLCLKQLAAFVTDRAPAHLKEVFASAMAGKTGLIVSARDMSAPPELAVPLLQTLLDEIDAARHSPYEVGRLHATHAHAHAHGRAWHAHT